MTKYLFIDIINTWENASMMNVSLPMDCSMPETRLKYLSMYLEMPQINNVPDIAPIVNGIIGKHWFLDISRVKKRDINIVNARNAVTSHQFIQSNLATVPLDKAPTITKNEAYGTTDKFQGKDIW